MVLVEIIADLSAVIVGDSDGGECRRNVYHQQRQHCRGGDACLHGRSLRIAHVTYVTDFCLFSGQSSRCAVIPLNQATSPAGRACNAKCMLQSPSLSSVETRQSWVVATVVLVVMAVAFGAPWITVVALKNIAAEVNGERSIPALAGALVWIGAGIGGINAPSYVYVSRWFDRRRGSALALISSGSFLAGAIWPSIFERAIAYAGWRHTMLFYAAIELVLIVPAAAIVLANPPDPPHHATVTGTARTQNSVLGWPATLVFAVQMCAIFPCCVPMSMPQAHLVAFCSDLGISPVHGAAMLSVLLGSAFLSRQVWGALSDRIGGLYTMLVGSACQTASLSLFMFTQDELGLFTVSALFGFGFSGLVPANVLASRELFPVGEAYWRIPTLLLCSGTGMATGAWIGGILYDHFGYYAPAFATRVAVSAGNFMIIPALAFRRSQTSHAVPA